MSKTQRIKGVLAPVVTPFDQDLNPDTNRFIAHCKWLIAQGSGLAAFGTNSEANSLSVNERLALLDALLAAGRVLAVERDWFLHPESFARLRERAVLALEAFHTANPLRPGMSREELRGRAGHSDERVFGFLLAALDAEGVVRSERDKVRLAAHAVRLTPEQQRVVDRLEEAFRKAEAAPPSPEEALGQAGVKGDEEHELFQVLLQSGRLVRVKESLFFHARAIDTIQDKLVAMLRERKEIGPGDIKDLLGVSRKYAIPLLEFFDQRRVTARVGERRVLRGG